MNKILITLALTLSVILLSAQEKYKFKKVSKDQLLQEEHEYYPEAEAAYLHNSAKVELDFIEHQGGFMLVSKFKKRIKIYKEDGFDRANIEIPLYKRYADKEKLSNFDAYTFNIENGKVKSEKLKMKEVYDEEVDKNWTLKKFAMPNVQEGSVIEIRYQITSPFTFRIPEFYMQFDIPCDYSEYEVQIPQYYKYNALVKGFFPITKTTDEKRSFLKYSYMTNNSTTITNSRKKHNERVEFTQKVDKYVGKDVPGLTDLPYVININNYKSSVSYELKSTHFPSSPVKSYTNSWDQVAKILAEESGFGGVVNSNNKNLTSVVNQISATEDVEKASDIYAYVNKNFSWNGKNRLYANGINKIFKEKTGNNADINLLLVALLKKAGMEAYPVVGKTRTNGFLNISFPVLADLNYVFACVKLGESYVFIDATEKGLPMGYLPLRAINLNGVIIDGPKAHKVDIVNNNEGKKVELINLSLADGKLAGDKTTKYSKYYAYLESKNIAELGGKSNYLKALADNDKKIRIDEIEIDEEMVKGSFKTSQKVDYSDYINEVEGKIFIPSLLDQGIYENPFKDEVRDFNVTFNHKGSMNSSIIITIPETHQIEFLPENKTFITPDEKVLMKVIYSQVGDKISINSVLQRKHTDIIMKDYEGLRMFYDEAVKLSNESIILAKK